MIEITEITRAYLDANFTDQQKEMALNSMFLMNRFSVPHWEDQFIELIGLIEIAEKDDVRDMFFLKLSRYMVDILAEHKIVIETEQKPELWELNELCHFLDLVQNLEDTEYLSYRLHADLPARRIITQLVAQYSRLTEARAMELISEVGDDLIEVMKEVAEQFQVSQTESIANWKAQWDVFLRFIDNAPCTGKRLSESGYGRLEFQQLLDLSSVDWEKKRHDAVTMNNHAQLALDILSMIMYSQDGAIAPMLVFDRHAGGILLSVENISKIKPIVAKMVSDLFLFKEAYRQSLNNNGVPQ